MRTTKLICTLPRNWERAYGYEGEARYVAFCWTPVGDEALYDDGQVSGHGNWQLFLTLRHQRPELDRCYNLGSSDGEADHWLLLDRETRGLSVLPRAVAQARLRQQWPTMDLNAELTALDLGLILEAVQQALDSVGATLDQIRPCDTCFYSIAFGWLQAADGGFDRCPVCEGWGVLPAPETAAGGQSLPAGLLTYRRES